MAGKNTAAFGIYPNEAQLRDGVETLEREGFRTADIFETGAKKVGTEAMGAAVLANL